MKINEHIKIFEAFSEIKGMGGVSNKWAETGNCQFIDYMNVYKHIMIDVNDLPFATVKNMNQDTLQCGDVLFTSASEVPDECAIAAEIEDNIQEGIFLDDHLFGLRLNSLYKDKVVKGYLKYYFRSENFRKQVFKAVRGVTRFYIAKPYFMNLQLPLPPLAIQTRIVEILDHFTNLTANLTAELNLRRKQFEHYREKLLSLDGVEGVEWKKLGEVCDVVVGGEPPKDVTIEKDDNHPFPIWGNGKDIYGFCNSYKIECDAVAISSIGANTGAIFFHQAYFTPIIRLKVLLPKDEKLVSRYLYYACSKIDFKSKKSSVPNMSAADVKSKKIPIPPLATQHSIVSILDKFTALIENIEKELALRQKQYEYYREELLRFGG
ncbi:MAG: restriction endonuclease subunit S [Bacteroidales bacterium]|nr:restriction endonuclease subunit S [Bacteroidales bacterium]